MMMLLAAFVLLASGCASFFSDWGGQRRGVSSSVVGFLYPKGEAFKPMQEGVPEIKLPARVGLMFVPTEGTAPGLSAADQQAMLEQVRDAFRSRPFIDRIEIIPQTYLRPGGGFDNLDQVARMYGVNVVALVSYDQVINTEESAGSLLYWTIIGAYTIPANRNQATTIVETTVFDVPSRTLLLRAPGQSQNKAVSTAIRVGDVQNRLAEEGFREAMTNMIANLDPAITAFSQRVREEGQVKLVERSSGKDWHNRSGGGGSVQPWELGFLLVIGVLLALRRRY